MIVRMRSVGKIAPDDMGLLYTWKSNHKPNKVWDGFIYPFAYFNGYTAEV